MALRRTGSCAITCRRDVGYCACNESAALRVGEGTLGAGCWPAFRLSELGIKPSKEVQRLHVDPSFGDVRQ